MEPLEPLLVYLCTYYADLGGSPDEHPVRTVRDHVHAAWMQRAGIGRYPKLVSTWERGPDRLLWEAYSRRFARHAFLFVVRGRWAHEIVCHVLRDGVWSQYASHLSAVCDLQRHYLHSRAERRRLDPIPEEDSLRHRRGAARRRWQVDGATR